MSSLQIFVCCFTQLVSYLYTDSLGMSFAALPGQVMGPLLGWTINPCLSLMWVDVAHIDHMDAG